MHLAPQQCQCVEEVPDYNEQVFWEPDPDSDADNKVAKLSSTTIKIVEDAFSHSYLMKGVKVPKAGCHYPVKAAKDADRNMARLQTLTLDAAPL